ncbi:MAG: hypothetical protein K5744_04235 [Eubacterium sp.]|nr:hypothetical protein [Eubacterium sp.]
MAEIIGRISGAALCFDWKEWFDPATIVAAMGDHWGNFISRMILALFAVCVWPLVIRKSCGNR